MLVDAESMAFIESHCSMVSLRYIKGQHIPSGERTFLDSCEQPRTDALVTKIPMHHEMMDMHAVAPFGGQNRIANGLPTISDDAQVPFLRKIEEQIFVGPIGDIGMNVQQSNKVLVTGPLIELTKSSQQYDLDEEPCNLDVSRHTSGLMSDRGNRCESKHSTGIDVALEVSVYSFDTANL